MFSYIRPIKFNVKILNGSKALAKCFGLVIIKTPKTNIIIPFWPSYYIPQNPQNTISQTEIRHYKKIRSVRNEYIRLVQTATDKGIKLKFETTVKERDQQLLDFITIDVLNIEQKHPSSQ